MACNMCTYYDFQFLAYPLHISSALSDSMRASLIAIQGPLDRNETCGWHALAIRLGPCNKL